MKKIITIEVDISKHEKYTNDQINQFLEFEFSMVVMLLSVKMFILMM